MQLNATLEDKFSPRGTNVLSYLFSHQRKYNTRSSVPSCKEPRVNYDARRRKTDFCKIKKTYMCSLYSGQVSVTESQIHNDIFNFSHLIVFALFKCFDVFRFDIIFYINCGDVILDFTV